VSRLPARRAGAPGSCIGVAICVLGFAVLAACGKKGPPLAPLHLVPSAPTEPIARRIGPEVRIQFTLPVQNVNGPGAVDIDRVEIYAVTVAPGATVPPNRELLVKTNVIHTLPVKPPPIEAEGQPAPAAAVQDDRPGPGERVTFTEALTPAQLTPSVVVKPLPPLKPDRALAALWAGPPALPDPTVLTRIYVIRGVSRKGHPGAASGRLSVPMVDPPEAAKEVKADVTETALTLTWSPPLASSDPIAALQAAQSAAIAETWLEQLKKSGPPPPPKTAVAIAPLEPYHSTVAPLRMIPGIALPLAPPLSPTFMVYEIVDGKPADTPVTPTPIAVATLALGAPEWERERCFSVHTVRKYGLVSIETAAGTPVCVTPHDTFAPKAPAGLRVVASPGAMNLIWNANAEPDLAGYLILRGTAPGDTLQAITPSPIRETTFKDVTVKPGVRYVYAIVAVDNAAKPNMSPQSPKQEEVAR
jgi:hypothetical protein